MEAATAAGGESAALTMAWRDVLGHEMVKRQWQAHLAGGRVANAYLLVGPDGVGKRRLAIEMARALACAVGGTEACGACPVCRQIGRGGHPDVHVIVPGGASGQIRIEEVRHLLGRLSLRPYHARTQVAVLEGIERLTEEAANSLLKALEEPSARAHFLLTTSQRSACLPTIVSRCQLVRCRPLPEEAVRRILTEREGCPPQVAEAVAPLAQGSASRAIELVGRWDACQRLMGRLDGAAPEAWLEQPLPDTRQEAAELVDGLMAWMRDVAVSAAAASHPLLHSGHREALRAQGRRVDVARCVEAALELVALRQSLEQFVSPRLVGAMAREQWLNVRS